MWPRIHSNRKPEETLAAAVRQAFSRYLDPMGQWGRNKVRSNPMLAFYSMAGLLLVSILLSFMVFRNREMNAPVITRPLPPVTRGLDRVLRTTGKLRETMALKQTVDSLSTLQRLSARDSARLLSALDRLQQLSKH
jgi:hypothetical protein